MLILLGFLALVLIGRGVIAFAVGDPWVGIVTTASGAAVFAVWFLLTAATEQGIGQPAPQEDDQEVSVDGA